MKPTKKTSIKRFYALEDHKLRRGYLHYVIFDRAMQRLGVIKVQTQSTRGQEHEVRSFLADNGYIPKKYMTGYERPENIDIRIIDVDYIIRTEIDLNNNKINNYH